MAEPSKKRRVSRACDLCRLKRAKCDGQTPRCSFCAVNNANCTYTKTVKKRGLPTGYIHDLEKKVATFQAVLAVLASLQTADGKLVEHHVVEMLQSATSNQILAQMSENHHEWELLAISGAVSQFIADNDAEMRRRKSLGTNMAAEMGASMSMSSGGTGMSQTGSIATHNNTNTSPNTTTSLFSAKVKSEPLDMASLVPSQGQLEEQFMSSPLADFALVSVADQPFFLRDDIFQSIADELDPGDARDRPVALHYYGLPQQISGFSGATIAKYTKHHLGRRNPFKVGSIFNVSSAVMAANAHKDHRKVPLDIFRFPANLRKLVDNYFQMYHLWLPMLDRLLVMRQVFRLQQHPDLAPDLHECNVLALLWAILALEGSAGENQAKYARNAVLALETAPVSTIETVQLMLLLGLHFYKTGDWDNSWVLVLSATRMAMDVRLMRPAVVDDELKKDDDRAKHPAWASLDKINRERTWASVYVINTLLGARMGRSPLVRETDWGVPAISEDGWEEWEAWKSFHSPEINALDLGRCLLIFNLLVQVVAILNAALTCVIDDEASMVRLIHAFQKRLDDWVDLLPSHCVLDPKSSPMVMYLHLCHSLAWFVVCVKVSALKPNVNPDRQKVVLLRNRLYTAACVKVASIFSSEPLAALLHYPFTDHCVLMALNFPHMNDLDVLAAAQHSSQLICVLELGARSFVPCHITWDMYRLQNGVDLLDDTTTQPEMLLGKSSYEKNPFGKFDKSPFGKSPFLDSNPYKSTGLSGTPPQTSTTVKDEARPLLLFFGENQKFQALPSFDYGRPRFASYNRSAPKEELDLFMLDTDFAKNDVRLDRFMRNLGYVSNGSKNGFLGQSLSNSASHLNSNLNFSDKPSTPGLLGSGSPDLEALSEILQKEKPDGL